MEQILRDVCAQLGIDPNTVNADVHFVTRCEIRELNRMHRGIDRPTDVLSFPMLDIRAGTIPTRENFSLDVNPQTGKIELGDIVVCKECAHGQTIEFLINHGFMHLLGYHHE